MPGTGVSAVNTARTQCWQLMPPIRRCVIIVGILPRSLSPHSMPSVAFLGLGAIGRPMAACLARTPGISLSVWNRSPDKAASFAAEHSVRHALTPADAARGADVVITCLPVSADVESLLAGPDGLLAAMARNSALVDCTSGDPATSRRIAERLAEQGVGYLDAPVSGGVKGAESGTLTVMVGGDAALLERVRPTLEGFRQEDRALRRRRRRGRREGGEPGAARHSHLERGRRPRRAGEARRQAGRRARGDQRVRAGGRTRR